MVIAIGSILYEFIIWRPNLLYVVLCSVPGCPHYLWFLFEGPTGYNGRACVCKIVLWILLCCSFFDPQAAWKLSQKVAKTNLL